MNAINFGEWVDARTLARRTPLLNERDSKAIRRFVEANNIRSLRVPGRRTRYSVADLDRAIEQIGRDAKIPMGALSLSP